ncbi:DUF1642 domain-containing protein [Streptococcus intermedius]|uniref:DUF1642 domain-containing protein n=1 Tax=Streptococcus intermedius TaxID=1338 RepID=UPI00123BE014
MVRRTQERYRIIKTKTVIPKHVAEWIERCKENELTITQALYRSPKFTEDTYKCIDWALLNQDLFISAWFHGYKIY